MKGEWLALLTLFFFNLFPIFGDRILESTDPMSLLIAKQIISAIIMIIVLKASGRIKEFKIPTKKQHIVLICTSIIGAALYGLFYFSGLSQTSVTNTILIGKAEYLLTPLLAVILLKEKINLKQSIGVIISFYGIYILATKMHVMELVWQSGDILVFLATISGAIGTVIYKKYLSKFSVRFFLTYAYIVSAIMYLLIGLTITGIDTVTIFTNTNMIMNLLGLIIIGSIIPNIMWFEALKRSSVTNVSLISLLSPIIGVIYAILLAGEILESYQIIGGILIIFGLVIVEMYVRKTYKPHRQKFRLKLIHARF